MTAPAPARPHAALDPLLRGGHLTATEAALAARYTDLTSAATAAKAARDWPHWRQLVGELAQVATDLSGGPLFPPPPVAHTVRCAWCRQFLVRR